MVFFYVLCKNAVFESSTFTFFVDEKLDSIDQGDLMKFVICKKHHFPHRVNKCCILLFLLVFYK